MGDHNLALMAIRLHDDKYAALSNPSRARMEKIEKWTDDFSTLTDFLTAVHAAQQIDKKHVDLSGRPELLEKVRSICPDLFPAGVTSWNTEDSLKLLTQSVNQQLQKIATLINPEVMLEKEDLQQIVELSRIFSEIVKTDYEGKKPMVRNQIH